MELKIPTITKQTNKKNEDIQWSPISIENEQGSNKGIQQNAVWDSKGSYSGRPKQIDRLFCAKCRKTYIIKNTDETCPSCGQRFRDETKGINTFEYYYPITIKGIPVIKIFGDKVCLWYQERIYFSSYDRKTFLFNSLNNRVVSYGLTFDTSTGQSYAYLRNRKKPSIRNISYGMKFGFGLRFGLNCDELEKIIGQEILGEIFNFIKELYKEKGIEVLEDNEGSAILTIPKIALKNRFPHCDTSFIQKFKLSPYDSIVKEIRVIKNLNSFDLNGPALLDLFAVKEEHKKKVFKSFVFQNPETLKHYRYFKNLESIDNIIKGMTLFKSWGFSFVESKYTEGKPRFFLKRLFKSNKESVIVKKLLNSNYSEFLDTCRMYQRINKMKLGKQINLNGSITEIHDSFADILNEIRNKNQIIKYKNNILSLNKKNILNYEFVLAKDTNELKAVGNKLHICVGSYDTRALESNCYIVLVKNAGEYIACIEIDSKKEKILQAKITCNGRPKDILKDAIIKWCQQNKLETDSCYDLISADRNIFDLVVGDDIVNDLPF